MVVFNSTHEPVKTNSVDDPHGAVTAQTLEPEKAKHCAAIFGGIFMHE